ncbi:MAG: hypothetical protein WBJ81_00865 [Rickettsiales bacterium]
MVGEKTDLEKAYEKLGVENNASVDDIKEAYQQKLEGLRLGNEKLRADSEKKRAVAPTEMIAAAAKQKKDLEAAYKVISEARGIDQKKEVKPVARSASPQRSAVSSNRDTTEKAPSFDKNKDYYAMLGIDKSNKEINQQEVASKHSVAAAQGTYSVKELNESAAVLINPEAKAAYDAARAPAQEKATPTVAVNPRFPRIAAMRKGLAAIGTAVLGAKSGPPSTPSKGQNANKGPELQ